MAETPTPVAAVAEPAPVTEAPAATVPVEPAKVAAKAVIKPAATPKPVKPAAAAKSASRAGKSTAPAAAKAASPAAPGKVAAPKPAPAVKEVKAEKPVKSAKPVKAEKPVKVEKAAKADKPVKASREKVVRDSFSMPKSEHVQLKQLRETLAKAGRICTKAELLRAGVQLLLKEDTVGVKALIEHLAVVPKGKGAK
ncbi:MAG: hypothetical protein JNM92_02115 [Zoogloea sp.]|nr:hypothetical protein [Zoogloea sp.]